MHMLAHKDITTITDIIVIADYSEIITFTTAGGVVVVGVGVVVVAVVVAAAAGFMKITPPCPHHSHM